MANLNGDSVRPAEKSIGRMTVPEITRRLYVLGGWQWTRCWSREPSGAFGL
jgi:hypothetical protein